MKNKLLMTTAVVALCTATSFVSAQSMLSGSELWTGGFIGVGGSFLDVSGDLYFEGYAEGGAAWLEGFETSGSEGVDAIAIGSGSYGTIEIGFDKQVNQYVYGGFASYDFGTTDAVATYDDAWFSDSCGEGLAYCDDASVAATISVGDNWAIGGRAGYLAGPNTLIYGLAGISSAHMSVSVDSTLEGFFSGESDLTVGDGSEEMDVTGTTFGAGIEHMLNNNWSIKLEYRNTVYDGFLFFSGEDGADFEGIDYGGAAYGYADVTSVTTQAIRAAVNYRF